MLSAWPIRRQLVASIFAVLVPFSLVVIWSANRTRAERDSEVQEQAGSIAVTAAAYFNQYLTGIDSMASALARHPAVAALDRARVDPLLAEVVRRQPLLLNIVLSDAAGAVRGSGLPGLQRTLGLPYAQQVFSTGASVVSELVTGPVTGKPTIIVAYPVHGADDAIVGVLGVGLNLSQLQTLFSAIPLPEGSTVTMTDERSRVLVRSRDAERYIGQPTARGQTPVRDVPRTQRMTGVDGVERFYGTAVVDRGPWLLSVGIPTSVSVDRVAPLWRRNLAMAIGAFGLGLLLALWAATLTRRGLTRVQLAVKRIADGDLSPPARAPVPNRELAELQDAFITMAANLREAREALDRRIEQERTMREVVQTLQRQVVRQERLAAVGLLVSGVAHEVNNPLQAILGTAELLERHRDLSPDLREELAFLKTQSGRARDIIRNLSRFSSQQSGPPALVDLHDVIAEVVQLRRRDLDSAAIALTIDAPPSRPVFANFTELEQVTLNFVINAQQSIEAAGRARGRILIRLFDTGRKVRVEVHDDGPGVAAADEAKLFQPFFTTKPVGKGTGLGLSVSYGIIDSYGGAIGYRGNEWGGAMFFFELPAAEPSSRPRAATDGSSGIDDPPPVLHGSVSSGV